MTEVIRSLYCLVFLSLIGACQDPLPKFVLSDEVTIDDLHDAFESGELTIEEVTQFYLERIEQISDSGPRLNAVIHVNQEAIEVAKTLDQEWKEKGPRTKLHGIPVLLKDNIDTNDGMPCTAGSLMMKGSLPLTDSPLAAQLRAAGAVLIGKTNLSEWANFHSSYSSSGWSALGGQTKNPYDLSRNPCGSSAGSGVAVAANLCVLAIGTETDGSIVCPSNNNGIVGIKPTVGLISRRGIIPISHTQDTGGPMARTVTDAVLSLGLMTSVDSLDEKTLQNGRVALSDYSPFLKKDGLKGKRIGYFKSVIGHHRRVEAVMNKAIEDMKSAGAEIVELEESLNPSAYEAEYQVLLYEFKAGLNAYFAQLGPDSPVTSIDDLLEQTLADSIEMHYFDHATIQKAADKGDLTDQEYLNALENARRLSQDEGIDQLLASYDLDAITSPTGGPAWKTDLTNGDNFGGVFSSSPAAIAGYPNITVPMGQIDGLPVGISFWSTAWTEPTLIEIAYAYEQATNHRMTPRYIKP